MFKKGSRDFVIPVSFYTMCLIFSGEKGAGAKAQQ